MLTAHEEHVATKFAEVFCEALPGSVLQTSALLSSVKEGRAVTTVSIVSIAISICATSFAIQMTCLDADKDQMNRRVNPKYVHHKAAHAGRKYSTDSLARTLGTMGSCRTRVPPVSSLLQ
jgi:hypothetical protein